MTRRGWTLAVWGLLALGLWLAPTPKAQAEDVQRLYHYPYYYYPWTYWPNQQVYPDPRKPFQQPPAYMAYPPYLDKDFRYELWRPHRYYRGFHFWLDQF